MDGLCLRAVQCVKYEYIEKYDTKCYWCVETSAAFMLSEQCGHRKMHFEVD